MKRIFTLVGLTLVLLVLATLAAPAAFAQGFTGDKVIMGEDFVLSGGDSLDGNLAVLGGSATLESDSTVHGDVTVAGGTMTVDGTITGNVSIMGGSLRLNDTAVVEGNVANFAGSVTRAPGATVRGSTFNGLRTPDQIRPAPVTPGIVIQRETPQSWFGRFINWQLGTIGSILLLGLLGLVLVLVAPRALGRVASVTATQPALTFGVGFLTLAVGLLAGGILLIACGLGLLIWLALLAGMVLGWSGVALWLGQRLLKALNMRSASSIAEVLVGVVIITLLGRLPCIGWLFGLIFASWGLGGVVLTRFGTQDAGGQFRPATRPFPPGDGSSGYVAPIRQSSDLDVLAMPFVPPAVEGEAEPPVVLPTEPAAETEPSIVTLEPTSAEDLGTAGIPEAAKSTQVLTGIPGIDSALAGRLQAAGIRTMADLVASSPVELAAATGLPVGQIMLEDWIGQARRMLS